MSLLREMIKYSKNPQLIMPRLVKKAAVPLNYLVAKNMPGSAPSSQPQKAEKPILLFGAFV